MSVCRSVGPYRCLLVLSALRIHYHCSFVCKLSDDYQSTSVSSKRVESPKFLVWFNLCFCSVVVPQLNLRDMFFHPYFVQYENGAGLTMVLNGLIRDHSQSRDRFMNKDLTDHLFQTKDGRSLDLASLNIQRGRDHGLPSFNAFRKACGLPSLKDIVKAGKLSDVPFSRVYR